MCCNIAILDDELLIRNSIKMKIDTPGFKVTFESDDGLELINYIKGKGSRSVDLAFIDIEMPLMNGLDVIAQIKDICPQMIFVIISGHDDFEYMQKAIRLGVKDYIMKPVQPADLNSMLEKLKKQLQERNIELKSLCMDAISLYAANKGIGNIDQEAVECFKYYFESGFRVQLTLLGNVESRECWFGRYSQREFSFIYPGMPNLLVSIISGESSPLDYNPPVQTITTFMSEKLTDINALPCVVENGINLIQQNIILGKKTFINKITNVSHGNALASILKSNVEASLKVISKHIEAKNYNKVLKLVEELFTYSNIPQILIEDVWRKVTVELYKHFGNSELLDGSWMKEIDSPEDIKTEAVEFLAQVLKHGQEFDTNKTGKDILYDVIAYINHNYHENMTLKDTATRFHINRSHLSRLFKKEINRTFNDFLTEIRIRKACHLLVDASQNIAEIALSVGYEDSRYFSQVFRKVTGHSPSEYARMKISKVSGRVQFDDESQI